MENQSGNKGGNWGPSIFFIANLFNFVLATAVFTIPFPMHESGMFLGTIILTITCFISVIACTLIVEALALKNSLLKREKSILNKALREKKSRKKKDKKDLDEKEEDKDKIKEIEIDKDRPTFLSKETLLSNIETDLKKDEEKKENDIIKIDNDNDNENLIEEREKIVPIENEEIDNNLDERNDSFYIYKRYEISKLAKALPKIGYFFVVITIICYLYVGVTSNGIIAGNNLKDIIGLTFGVEEMPGYSYYVVLLVFFVIVIIIALNNIKHLKKFSMFIMVMRFVIIFLIMGCCIYSMKINGIASFMSIPKFDFSNITVMIGNSLFVFMSHHSIPGMVENFSPQRRLIKLLIIGYAFSLFFIVLYSYVGLFAFGDPGLPCDKKKFPMAIQSTFSTNFLGLPVVGYIINYYPILNVITSGMQLITLRNNILEAIAGCNSKLSESLNFAEQSGITPILKNFVFNTIIAIPPLTIGLLLQNIQSLMKYFSSILGFLLMLIVPILVVSKYRLLFKERGYYLSKLNRSFLKSKFEYPFIIIMSFIIFGFIIFGFIKNTNNKTCINEK